jgi:hypothetical protein
MSSQTIALNTGQQLTVNTDIGKIFVWENRYSDAAYTNGGGAPVTLTEGTLLGRIAATGKIVPLTSAANDGSQFPVGILNQTVIVAAGETRQLSFCVSGDVVENKVLLQGADTLDTVVAGKTIRDRIGSDTVGVKLVTSTELTGYDN